MSKDDITSLKADNTYTMTDSGSMCAFNSSDNGTWSLSGETITVDSDNATVQNFTCSGFSATGHDFDMNGDTITFTYVRQ